MLKVLLPLRWTVRCRTAALGAVVALAAFSLLAPAQSADAAASGPQRAAYFVGADGRLDYFGSTASGGWSQAVPLTSPGSAPAGSPVAAVRAPSGRLLAYYVAGNGAVYKSCSATAGTFTPVTGAGFARPGSHVATTIAGGAVQVAVPTASGDIDIAADPDVPICGNDLTWHWWPHWPWPWPPGPPPWWDPDGDFTIAGYGDGEVGIAQIGLDGGVHVLWGASNGQWQQAQVTGPGTASAGGGIVAVTSQTAGAGIRGAAADPNAASPNAASPTPGSTSLFFAGNDGRIYVEHPAAGGASDTAVPLPAGSSTAVPLGAHLGALAAADGSTQTAYISTTGALVLISRNGGSWQPPKQLTGPGFAAPGISLSVIGSSATDLDIIYCGSGAGPGHLHLGPGGPAWYSAGSAALVVAGTGIAAAQ